MSFFSFIFSDDEQDAAMSESKSFRIKFNGEALADLRIPFPQLYPSFD
jgi:hypothetical protein